MKTVHLFTALALAGTISTAAFAEDPPPPPPPPEEGGGSGSGIRAQGGLLDASNYDSRPMILSVHGLLPYGHFGIGYFPIGVGASFYIPIVKNGFIPKLNDEFGIDFGADFVFYLGSAYPFSLYLPVGVQWKFHILEKLEAYAKIGFLAQIWFGYTTPFLPWPYGMVGIHYWFSKNFGLKAEVGYPGIRAGVVFAF
ncbi:MAG: hypothetical protein U0228_30315 [Myxococcaceae bacterium]